MRWEIDMQEIFGCTQTHKNEEIVSHETIIEKFTWSASSARYEYLTFIIHEINVRYIFSTNGSDKNETPQGCLFITGFLLPRSHLSITIPNKSTKPK